MSAEPELTPLQILAIAEIYVLMADDKVKPEERATLISLFGKHVSKKEIPSNDVKRLTANAFEYVERHSFEDFLIAIESAITMGQAIAIYANMYEAMIVDGNVVALEKERVEKFHRFFGIEKRVVNAIREILMVKNDTGIFLREDHPNNGSDFHFGFIDLMDPIEKVVRIIGHALPHRAQSAMSRV